MEFSTIEARLQNNEYPNRDAFLADVGLLFDNALLYNQVCICRCLCLRLSLSVCLCLSCSGSLSLFLSRFFFLCIFICVCMPKSPASVNIPITNPRRATRTGR